MDDTTATAMRISNVLYYISLVTFLFKITEVISTDTTFYVSLILFKLEFLHGCIFF